MAVKKAMGTLLVILLISPVLWAQQPLAITRVLLYKNGMAYIVRSGQINGPVSLTFHPEDMNDVLKSFAAWDPDTASLYSVGYTAGIPSSHMLSRFPFDITSPETGLGGFLVQDCEQTAVTAGDDGAPYSQQGCCRAIHGIRANYDLRNPQQGK